MQFYRQSMHFRYQGVDLSRAALSGWASQVAAALKPLATCLADVLRGSGKLFVDETSVPVLAPGTGKTREDWM